MNLERRLLQDHPEHGQSIKQQSTPPAAIEVQIDELVLDGFVGLDGAQIGAAVQQELARLLAEGEVSTFLMQSGAIAQMDGGALTVHPGANAEGLGAQIARAVYGGLTQ